jgi:formylglycine-generating enzyme required for sulfatase activity
MSSVRLPLPCAAYTGKEPYIFVSYTHVDGERVYPEIKALYERGYRIWYDEGIDPSDEWLKKIALAIDGSAIFIVFITREAIQSYYVNKEVKYAINERKLLLPVYLEEVSLPKDWKLGMGDIQAVMKWRMSEDDYSRKMMKVIPGGCLEKSGQVVARDVDKNTIQELHMPDNFVFIKGENYLMGSPDGKAERSDDETQHQVRVGDFYMAKYPVTVAQFETFISEANYRTDADKEGWSYIWYGKNYNQKSGVNWRYDIKGELQKDIQHPVIHVSWNDASAYCKWLSKKLNKALRLPTEAEWEYACRAGTTTPFNTGENLTAVQANYDGNYPYQNNPKGKFIGTTTPVGSYPANKWGLYDIHGNVWEWCRDWYGEKYYNECKQQGITDNPPGPETGSYRVLRGGSWDDDARGCRSARRHGDSPGRRDCSIGFRLVFIPESE